MFSSPSTFTKVFGSRLELNNRDSTWETVRGDGNKQMDEQETSPTGQADSTEIIHGDPSLNSPTCDDTLSSTGARDRKLLHRNEYISISASQDHSIAPLTNVKTPPLQCRQPTTSFTTLFHRSSGLLCCISRNNFLEWSSATDLRQPIRFGRTFQRLLLLRIDD